MFEVHADDHIQVKIIRHILKIEKQVILTQGGTLGLEKHSGVPCLEEPRTVMLVLKV